MRKRIQRFGGLVNAVDARSIADYAASDLQNVRVGDAGTLLMRYGYREVAAAQANFTASYGIDAVAGFTSTGTEAFGYLSFEAISGTVKPFWRLNGNMAANEITNGGSALSLTSSPWRSFAYGNYIYAYNPDANPSVRFLTISSITGASYNSFGSVRTPNDPATKPTLKVVYNSSDTKVYGTVNYAGISPATEVAYTGSAQSSYAVSGTTYTSYLTNANELLIYHDDDNDVSSVEIDLQGGTAGVQDWTYNDIFYCAITSGTSKFKIDEESLKVQFINNDGSPKTLDHSDIKIDVQAGSGGVGNTYHVWFEFYDKTRADFDNVRKIKFTYRCEDINFDATPAGRYLIFRPITVGCVRLGTDYNYLGFRYTYYESTSALESGFSPYNSVPVTLKPATNAREADGSVPAGRNLPPLGSWIKLTWADPGAAADNVRLYVQDRQQGKNIWRRVVTQSDASLNYYYRITQNEMRDLTEYSPPGPFALDDVVSACNFRRWAVWGTKGGKANIKHSRVEEPLKLARSDDDELDLNRGADFTLNDSLGDEPYAMYPCGESLMIVGGASIYSQYGDRPYNMSPPKKIPGSVGAAGKFASCLCTTSDGGHAVAYLTRDGGSVRLALPQNTWAGEGSEVVISSALDEAWVRDWLKNGKTTPYTDLTHVQMGYDAPTEAIWVVSGTRALVLRPNGPNRERMWEAYDYNLGGTNREIKYIAFEPRRRMRAITSDGRAIELEWNNSSLAYIQGTNRDGGNAPTSAYWVSKTESGERRRLHRASVERSGTGSVEVKAYTNELTAGDAQVTGTGHRVRFAPTVKGREHYFRVLFAEANTEVFAVNLDVNSELGGVNRA